MLWSKFFFFNFSVATEVYRDTKTHTRSRGNEDPCFVLFCFVFSPVSPIGCAVQVQYSLCCKLFPPRWCWALGWWIEQKLRALELSSKASCWWTIRSLVFQLSLCNGDCQPRWPVFSVSRLRLSLGKVWLVSSQARVRWSLKPNPRCPLTLLTLSSLATLECCGLEGRQQGRRGLSWACPAVLGVP